MVTFETLTAYWSANELGANLMVFLNLFGALLLGLMVGYERSYHGRAAGMRTYGLVCMASAALTVIGGYPSFWFGGHAPIATTADPTRIIQGIVTGIGFLGAGVIMKEGFNISGLTTAASLWASSVTGIMVGIGFYPAAIMLGLLCAVSMIWVSKLEAWLPSRHAVAIVLRFKQYYVPQPNLLRDLAYKRGYQIASGSLSILYENGRPEWHLVAVALSRTSGAPLTDLARELSLFEGVEGFQLSHARN